MEVVGGETGVELAIVELILCEISGALARTSRVRN